MWGMSEWFEVVHVVGGDLTRGAGAALGVFGRGERVVCVGAGQRSSGVRGVQVRALWDHEWGRRWALRRALRRLLGADLGRVRLVAYSVEATRWCLDVLDDVGGVVVRHDVDEDAAALAELIRLPAADGDVRCWLPSEAARERLVSASVTPDACEVIREGWHVGANEEGGLAQREAARRRLNIDPQQWVVAGLPSGGREESAFTTAWAALLLEKVEPRVVMALPADVRRARIQRLFRSCGHEFMLRTCGDVDACLSVADVAVFVPRQDAPLGPVLRAASAGVPLVVSQAPGVRELLSDAEAAWFCDAQTPRDVTATILRALENTASTAQRGSAGCARARAWARAAESIGRVRGLLSGVEVSPGVRA